MPKRQKSPELKFQEHIADYLIREHKYGVLEQTEITDTTHYIAENDLWAFLRATQADTLKKLAEDYGTDAREEVFRALRKELERTPLWMILRQGLKVRGLEFRLFYPKPRSAESAGAEKYPQNRITFRPHCYFGAAGPGDTQCEIDFAFFLNGLPSSCWRSSTRPTRTCMMPWRSSPPATARTRFSSTRSFTSPPTPAT
jgi:type I restriction enzyme R subunit